MKRIPSLSVFLASCLVALPALAVTVSQCEDDKGNRSYAEFCPPGTKRVNEKEYATSTKFEQAEKKKLEVVLYSVPGCELCTQMREFLTVRQVPFTEKNVNDDADLQNELKKKAGTLKVPTLIVGDKAIVGYNRGAAAAALVEGGYLDASAIETAPEQPATPPPGAENAGPAAPPAKK